MNLILLLAACRAWQGPPLTRATRAFTAVSALSVELQVVTWTGWGTLAALVPFNVVLAGLGLWLTRPRRSERDIPHRPWPPAPVLWTAAGTMVVVAVLNLSMPPTAVDPYHLERVAQIERTGTVAYDRSADPSDPRVNVLGWLYEALLADVRLVPGVGNRLLQLHGLLGVALYTTAVCAMFSLLRTPAGWPMAPWSFTSSSSSRMTCLARSRSRSCSPG